MTDERLAVFTGDQSQLETFVEKTGNSGLSFGKNTSSLSSDMLTDMMKQAMPMGRTGFPDDLAKRRFCSWLLIWVNMSPVKKCYLWMGPEYPKSMAGMMKQVTGSTSMFLEDSDEDSECESFVEEINAKTAVADGSGLPIWKRPWARMT